MNKFWKNYRHRFVPWVALNLKHRKKREVHLSGDKIVADADLLSRIIQMTAVLHDNIKSTCPQCSKVIMFREQGYSVDLFKSSIKGAGTGVCLTKGTVKEGDLIALYPGTLYRRFEPILIPSIGNAFVLRCMDGIHLDGNNKFLSNLIYTSCVKRDSDCYHKYVAADLSWLTPNIGLKVPWNIGQYVNNCVETLTANVAYQELDLFNFPGELDYLLPNIWYSGPQGRHLRTVVLVATQNIKQGDEILSNYVTLLNDNRPSNIQTK